MALISGMFNSIGGDRAYDAAYIAERWGRFVSNGLWPLIDNNMLVKPASGMVVSVQPGYGWINGYDCENTDLYTLSLQTASGINPRIDRVVLRLSIEDRAVALAVKTGIAAVSPKAPELTRDTNVYELALADVAVASGAVEIQASSITDLRSDPVLCGTVNALMSAVYQ